MSWDLSCRDWEERIRAGRSLVPDLPLNQQEADRAVAVFNKLRLADVTGTPTLADAAGEWFRDIVRALFGSANPSGGLRFIQEIFCLVPKKNSKTSYGALLMLVVLLLNRRPHAPFFLTAPVQDTAEMAFEQAAGAIDLDPVLQKKFHVRSHLKTIVHRETKAELEILTFDSKIATGRKSAGGLIDEMHVIAKMKDAASALRQLRGGMLPFPDAFLITITTQSEEPPVGIFKSELHKARDVRDGKLVAPILPILYEYPEAIQKDPAQPWKNPALWHMVTPNAGRSIAIPTLVEAMRMAELAGEAEVRAWASQHLNIEVGIGTRWDHWAGAEFWEACAEEGLTLDALLERCEVVVAGIDGGGLDDLLGFALVGRERDTRRWLVWTHAWAHRIVLQRRPEIASALLDFEADRDLTIVNKPGDDVVQIAEILCRVRDLGLLPEKDAIGVDAQGIGEIVDELTAPGRDFTMEQIIAIPQNWKLNGAIKTTERKLAGGEIVQSGSRMMNWCVGNARTVAQGNATSITKAVSGSAKIDPLMGVFDANTLMARNPVATGTPTFAWL